MFRGKNRGRPSTLTPTVHKALVKSVRIGMPYAQAAMILGLSEGIITKWLKRGREAVDEHGNVVDADSQIYYRLFVDLKAAEAERLQEALGAIQDAATLQALPPETKTVRKYVPQFDKWGRQLKDPETGEFVYAIEEEVTTTTRWKLSDWKAAAWYAERKFPDLFSRMVKVSDDSSKLELLRELAEREAKAMEMITSKGIGDRPKILRDNDDSTNQDDSRS